MNDENVTTSAGSAYDNLEEIDGIGPGYAKALNQIGIRSFADLARYNSADELRQALLAQTGIDVPLWKIEKGDWIGQANALATMQRADTEWVNQILDQTELSVDTGALPQASDPPPKGTSEATVDARSHVKATVPSEGTRIEITEVQVSEIGPSSAVPEKQIQAQVRFQISGPMAERLAADRLSFRTEVHIVDVESGRSSLVSSALGQLYPQVFEYTSRQQFAIPEVGRYRVHCLTLLLPPGNLAAYHEGPVMTIVP